MVPTDSSVIRSPELRSVSIDHGFWRQLQAVNRETTIPVEYEQLEITRRLEILKGGWTKDADYVPHIFWDSDVAKWLEAAAYSLESHPDSELEARCDRIIDDLAALQGQDGYLNSYFSQVEPEARWTNLRDRHELYCAGHLMEAAVAYARATGKRRLLEVMCRYADYISTVFGPESGKKKGYPGHEEIELALVKLSQETGEAAYLELSKYFIDQRGRQPHYYDEEAAARGEAPDSYRHGRYDYLQAHVPVREQTTAEGHSVRACYLYSGMADVARETGDEELAKACRKLWRNITERRMYIHGGIGSSHHGERFTFDYDLSNEEAYAETCAAIALVLFAQRMFLLDHDGRYIDVLERALYNGVISGVSADGKRFFYDNYLASKPGYHEYHARKSPDRQEWFGCACCPPNLARLLASLGSYLFASSSDTLWLNLYAGYDAKALLGELEVAVAMRTTYPWEGKIEITVTPAEPTTFDLALRIPSWCHSFRVEVNGEEVEPTVRLGYATVGRRWEAGDRVLLVLEMPVEQIVAHPSVRHDNGKAALQRGPILYCLEEVDNGPDLANLSVPIGAKFETTFDADLLGGVVTVSGEGLRRSYDGWDSHLYRSASAESTEPRRFTAVPYYAWDNRGVGEMTVWINTGDPR